MGADTRRDFLRKSALIASTALAGPGVAGRAGGTMAGFVQHHNGIFPWSLGANGEVRNAIA